MTVPEPRPEPEESAYGGQRLDDFLERVAAREAAPGGGAAAAVTVALGAALTAMAARFSEEQTPDAAALAAEADALRVGVLPLADEDAAAYGEVLAAYRASGSGGEPRERARRALSRAADVPLAIAEAGASVAELAARIAVAGNPNLQGDATTAVHLAESATVAAADLVTRNLCAADLEDVRRERAQALVGRARAARERVTDLERDCAG